jgi:seryl-tRNA synthetase
MLDLKLIRSDPERVRRGLAAKRAADRLDRVLALDESKRRLLQEVEVKKADRNRSSHSVARVRGEGGDPSSLMQRSRGLAEEIRLLDARVAEVDSELEELLQWLPNIPHETVPVGPDSSANVEVRRWGSPGSLTPEPLPHWEIGERLGWLDFDRASRVSGAGFAAFTGDGARLRRALIQFMLDLHTRRHGFREVSTPYLVRRRSMFGTGQLPKMESEMYRSESDDLFLIPTAEVPITNLYRGEVLSESDLPLRLVGYSPCFRREAGAAGRETRGLVRMHQFDKIELVEFAVPDDSYAELESLVECAEAVLRALELPYRVLSLASGDLSFAAAKCYDLEVWAPAEGGRWLEVSSCSNYEAFQSRRIGLRYRSAEKKLRIPHTLNGSGVALPRTLVALLEAHQTVRGTVRIPAALRPYLDGAEELG